MFNDRIKLFRSVHALIFSTVKIDVADIAFRDATFPQLIHNTAQQTRFSATANACDHLNESHIVIERTKLG